MLLKLLFLDLETTGTDPVKNGIVQISGAVQIREDMNIVRGETFNFNLKPFPTDVIEDEALEVTGLTRDDVLNNPERLDPMVAQKQFVKMLCKYVDKFKKTDKFFIVGFATTFDDNFLRAFFVKCNDKYYGSMICWPPIDLAVLAALNLGPRRMLMPNFKLATTASAIGIPVDPGRLHDASYDIDLTIALFDWCHGRIFFHPGLEAVDGGSTIVAPGRSEIAQRVVPQV